MLEQLQNELEQKKSELAQVIARLNAGEQFINSLLKEMMDAKTNLNLYMQANIEINQEKKRVDEELNKLGIETDYLKNELNNLKNNTNSDQA